MLLALTLAAFLGAGIGLVWQNLGWFSDEEEEHEIVTAEAPEG